MGKLFDGGRRPDSFFQKTKGYFASSFSAKGPSGTFACGERLSKKQGHPLSLIWKKKGRKAISNTEIPLFCPGRSKGEHLTQAK